MPSDATWAHCDAHVKELKQKYHEMRAQQRALEKRLRRKLELPNYIKAAFLLILFLSGSRPLAMIFMINYIESWKPHVFLHSDVWEHATTQKSWIEVQAIRVIFFEAFLALDSPLRLQIDEFLIESLVAEVVHQQNLKGVVVPLRDVLIYYAQHTLHLPHAELHRDRLAQILSVGYSRQWGRSFRARWYFHWGDLKKAKPFEGESELQTRALHLHRLPSSFMFLCFFV